MAPEKETMFRSADMSMIQLFTPDELAREVVTQMGEVGLIQFRDLNSEAASFSKTFTSQIRRLENLERQLRYFHGHIERANLDVRKVDLDTERFSFPTVLEIDDLSERAQTLENRITQLNDSYETLKKREVELTEWRWVLREAGGFFDRAHQNVDEMRQSIDVDDAPLLQDVEPNIQAPEIERSFAGMNVGFVAGVIAREKIEAFERILWRSLRGNLYMNQSEIPEELIDPKDNKPVKKNVFVIFANGRELLNKIRKISESIGAVLYQVDENSDLRRDQIHEVNERLHDVQNVLQNTQLTLEGELANVAATIAGWMMLVTREKAVYETLNRFSYKRDRHTLVAEGWAPTEDLPAIRAAVQEVNLMHPDSVPSIISEIRTGKTPPTYHRTNKFTEAFQTIINSYGTTTYKEVNPALASIVTFPFLFAVMFGDIGHATIMVLFASAMIFWEKSLKKVDDEMFSMLFYGRYIALVMGLFACYTGFIYNDAFSLSLPIFKSAWVYHKPEGYANNNMTKLTAELNQNNYRYPFGLDHAWHGVENDLIFTNSYKMKVSIILGWAHMTYSLCLMVFNARYFKKPIDIWGVFLPSMIFFQSIFGYLVFCIIYKWTVNWAAIGKRAPGLLNLLIYMFLSPGTIDTPLYNGQAFVQVVLLLMALVCVPCILLMKPLYLRHQANKARRKGYAGIGEALPVYHAEEEEPLNGNGNRHSVDTIDGAAEVDEEEHEGGGHGHDNGEFDFGEEMIHQTIHTIEFCLNCISHTASYLRLWALSLAHQQLSKVLWDMTLLKMFNMAPDFSAFVGGIMIFLGFGFWLGGSVIALVGIEGVSAMLHSLRLQWVEAQSKFAEFGGWPFEPFALRKLVEESEDLKPFRG